MGSIDGYVFTTHTHQEISVMCVKTRKYKQDRDVVSEVNNAILCNFLRLPF